MKAPFEDDIDRILDNADTSDLGRLNYKLLELATSRVGYRRKLILLKGLFLSECQKHTDGKETKTNKTQSGQETG